MDTFYFDDEISKEELALRKKVSKIFDLNDSLSKKIRAKKDFKRKDFKVDFDDNFIIKFYPKEIEFFKKKYPNHPRKVTIGKLIEGDLLNKILNPSDYFR